MCVFLLHPLIFLGGSACLRNFNLLLSLSANLIGAMNRVVVASAAIVVACEIAVRRVVPQTAPRRDRVLWHAVHGLCNAVVAALTWDEAWSLLARGPTAAACLPGRSEASTVPIALTLALHVWHAVAYRLTSADVFHHAVFIPLLALPGYLWDWGDCGNALLFFVNGLPGAVLYLLSAAQGLGRLLRVPEPRLTCLLTTGVRLPGALLSCAQLHRAWTRGNSARKRHIKTTQNASHAAKVSMQSTLSRAGTLTWKWMRACSTPAMPSHPATMR